MAGSFSVAFAIILVFKVDRLGICVVLFLAVEAVGASSTLDSAADSSFLGASTSALGVSASVLGVSTSALGAGALGGAVTTFFFQHLIRAVRD